MRTSRSRPSLSRCRPLRFCANSGQPAAPRPAQPPAQAPAQPAGQTPAQPATPPPVVRRALQTDAHRLIVRDPRGLPLRDVHVSVLGPGDRSVSTGPDGRAEVPAMPDGPYRLRFDRRGLLHARARHRDQEPGDGGNLGRAESGATAARASTASGARCRRRPSRPSRRRTCRPDRPCFSPFRHFSNAT